MQKVIQTITVRPFHMPPIHAPNLTDELLVDTYKAQHLKQFSSAILIRCSANVSKYKCLATEFSKSFSIWTEFLNSQSRSSHRKFSTTGFLNFTKVCHLSQPFLWSQTHWIRFVIWVEQHLDWAIHGTYTLYNDFNDILIPQNPRRESFPQ